MVHVNGKDTAVGQEIVKGLWIVFFNCNASSVSKACDVHFN